MSVRHLIEAQAERTPGATAIVAPGRAPLTYGRLRVHIDEIVKTLNAMGLGRNDRVAVVFPDGPEMAVAFVAVSAAATSAPLNPAYRESEFDFYLTDLRAQAVILQAGVDSPARAVAQARGIPIIELFPRLDAEAGLFTLSGRQGLRAARTGFAQPGDVALVLHTSGTTSRPKLVPLTQANLCTSAQNIQAALQLLETDRCLNIMPLFHIHGLVGATLSSLAAGASVVCTPGFYAPQFFGWVDEFRPTWYTAVPTMHQAILARAESNPEVIARCRLRLIRASSSALAPQLMAQLEEVFRVPVIESYGMTEASHQMASNPLPPRQRKPGSVGVAAGPEVAVMDEAGRLLPPGQVGEVVIRGANVTLGYENNPEANGSSFSGGWFRTGDQGHLDGEGYLFLTGRLKELINRGGEKVSPREVDEALLGHPAVAQAVAFAVPDARLGEQVAAAVVLRENAVATERDLREFAAERLADFKVPRRVLVVEEIPKGSTGKVQRLGLAERLGLTALGEAGPEAQAAFEAARTPVEERLTDIWGQVLGLGQVGVHDNFFQLGGDSILATQVISRVRAALKVELPLLSFFEAATIADQARNIERAAQVIEALPSPPMQPISHDGDLPLSFAQQRLWFLDQLEPSSSAYNMQCAVRLSGPLQIDALGQSLNEILRRHEALRTTFLSVQGRPVQVIASALTLALPVVDLRQLAEAEREVKAQRLATREVRQPFDLARGPLLRTTLLQLSDEEHLLVLTIHHIVSDGWSMGVFVRELGVLYGSFIAGKPSPLPELPIQYADFAHWQRQWLQGEALEKQLSYWRQQLGGSLPALGLPTDYPRPATQSFRGGRQTLVIPKTLTQALKVMSLQQGVTLFMMLLAAFQTLLHRLTGQDDIIVGTPIAGRIRIETEQMIGFFVNTLSLRGNLSGDPTFRELLGRVREVALGAYAHQDLPFQKLVEELQPERDLSHSPLFQVMFALQNVPGRATQLAGLRLQPLEVEQGATQFDLTLSVVEEAGGLRARMDYSKDLFEAATVKRLLGHYQTLLEGVVLNAGQRLSALPLLTQSERQQLAEWNKTERSHPRDQSLQGLFEAQVERMPEAVAVVFEGQRLTYGELNRRANQLAHYLRALGVGPEVRVGLCLERSLEMVIGLLGILKAGGAYLPLDPAHPPQRLAFMLEDAQVPVLLTRTRWTATLPSAGARLVCLDEDSGLIARHSVENPSGQTGPEALAYIIYTSGSTGEPKGVLVCQHNVTRLLSATQPWFQFDGRDVWTLFHSSAFDFSVWEMWGALGHGGRLVVVPGWMTRSPDAFYELLAREQVTVLNQTPSAFYQLLRVEEERREKILEPVGGLALRLIIFGGEALDVKRLRPWFERHGEERPRLVNMYGITETTVHVTYRPLSRADLSEERGSPIGRPLRDLQLYLLDQHGGPVPVGVPGEIYVGGDGLSRGYLNRPELSAERFIPNSFGPEAGARLYKTGDRARCTSDGELVYLGRNDSQVKIRGYRIELGEIEAVLSRYPTVREAVVVAREGGPGEQRLVAYVVPGRGPAPAAHQLRGFLKDRLPEYMVPASFVLLEVLPLTPSGKVDRADLPAPKPARPDLGSPFVAARTPVEEELAAIWRGLLGIERVGIHDNFFELGGHSLSLTQLASRLQQAFGVQLPLRVLFEATTISDLSTAIAAAKVAQEDGAEVAQMLEEIKQLSPDEARALLLAENLSGTSEDGQ